MRRALVPRNVLIIAARTVHVFENKPESALAFTAGSMSGAIVWGNCSSVHRRVMISTVPHGDCGVDSVPVLRVPHLTFGCSRVLVDRSNVQPQGRVLDVELDLYPLLRALRSCEELLATVFPA